MQKLYVPEDIGYPEIVNSTSINQHNVERYSEKIIVSYAPNFDIDPVWSLIKKNITSFVRMELPKTKKDIEDLERLFANSKTVTERKNIKHSIDQKRDYVKTLEFDNLTKKYENQTRNLVLCYNEYKKKQSNSYYEYRKSCIVEEFINISSSFVDIDYKKSAPDNCNLCINCRESLEGALINKDKSVVCSLCDHQQYMTFETQTPIQEDIKDESIENFLRALDRYQGLQNVDIPESLHVKLDNYFTQRGIEKGEKIRSLPLNKNGRKDGTNHKMLILAFSEIDSNYYEHVNLVAHHYWGWALPNVFVFRDKIISHYKTTQRALYSISEEERGRSSSLGTQYRLWRHLQLVGVDCSMDEFKIAENADSIKTHHKLWELMCERSNDPEIYSIP